MNRSPYEYALDLTAVTTCRDGLVLDVDTLGWRVRVTWDRVACVWLTDDDAAGVALVIDAYPAPVPCDEAMQQYVMWTDAGAARSIIRAWNDWGPESLGGAVQRFESLTIGAKGDEDE